MMYREQGGAQDAQEAAQAMDYDETFPGRAQAI
jgi:hypothetical protein